MPFCTYLKQLGALPISQNSRGAKSESVSTKDTRDAYDIINRFISKERKMVLSGADRSDWFALADTKKQHFIVQMHHTNTKPLR